jgi:2-(1,2-epoxy-1,2-dihydrophenyl)acetyl-CoA isomerase
VPELTAGLAAALARAGQDGARVVVLAGRGRAFCSGHDLKEPVPPETVLQTRRRVDGIQDVTRAIRRFPGPVVAAVHGYALGAGCEFALGCDLVVAAEDAQFGFPEVSVGLSVTGASPGCCRCWSAQSGRRNCCCSASGSARPARSSSGW